MTSYSHPRQNAAAARRNIVYRDQVVIDVDGGTMLVHLKLADARRLYEEIGQALLQIAFDMKPTPVGTESGMTELDVAVLQAKEADR
ncbi:hypothetical protein [Nocardia sp. NBC_00511]|uniref:hypothetical protein n=1 Tax=Nocardia sp. NBC_00511 TaxID=2903591 RepID=UPI0030E4B61E